MKGNAKKRANGTLLGFNTAGRQIKTNLPLQRRDFAQVL